MAVVLTGSEYIDLDAHAVAFSFTPQPVSFAIAFVTESTGVEFLFCHDRNGDAEIGFYHNNGTLNIRYTSTGGSNVDLTLGGGWNDGNLHRVLAVWTGGTLQGWVDGALVDDASSGNMPTSSDDNMNIGAADGGLNFVGELSECAVWSTALSSGDAADLTDGTSALDDVTGTLEGWWPLSADADDASGNDRDGTPVGDPDFTGGGAVDGTAAGSYAYSGTASGQATALGSAAGSYGYSGAAAGQATAVGSADGSYAYAGTAEGQATVIGSASGSYAYDGSATGQATAIGSASGSYGYAGTATGEVAGTGSASGSYGFSGTAEGRTTVIGSASGSYGYSGTAAGSGASTAPTPIVLPPYREPAIPDYQEAAVPAYRERPVPAFQESAS